MSGSISPSGRAVDYVPAVCIGIVEMKRASSAGAGAYTDICDVLVLVSGMLVRSECCWFVGGTDCCNCDAGGL